MAATGFASLAVGLDFSELGSAINKGLVEPMQKSAQRAGDAMEKTLVDSAVKAEKAVAQARGKQEKATQQLEKAVKNLRDAEDAVVVATKQKSIAETDYEKTVRESSARVESAERKLLDLKKSGKATTEQLEKAERDLANARDKASMDVESKELKLLNARKKVEAATDKARSAQMKLADANNNAVESADELRRAQEKLATATDEASDSAQAAGDEFGGMSGVFDDLVGKLGPVTAALGGVLGGGALLSAGKATADEITNIQNRLGLTGEAADAVGESIRETLKGGVAASAEEAASVVGALEAQFDDLGVNGEQTSAQLADNFLAFSKTFGVDVAEATQTAGQLIQNGLASDVESAADLMTVAMQRVPDAMKNELPEIINEYGVNFANLGLSGEEAFTMLVNQAENGKWALDKTGDALKEFTIRGSDMSATSVAAYEKLGLSAEDMSSKIAAGGEGAREAMEQTAQKLLEIEDPAERANAAIALFGTPLEDIGVDQIPAFLEGLTNLEGGMGVVEGASQQLGDTVADSLDGRLSTLKNTVIDLGTGAFMGLWDAISSGIDFFGRFSGIILPLGGAFTGLATAVGVYAAAQKVAAAGGFLQFMMKLPGVTAAVSAAQMALNVVMAANPIILVTAALAGLVAGLVVFFTKTEAGRAAWEKLKAGIAAAIEAIKAKISEMVTVTAQKIEAMKGFFTRLPEAIKSVFSGAGSWLRDAGANIIRGLADGVRSAVGFVQDALRAVIPDNLERFVPGLHFGGLAGFARGGVLPRVPGIPDSVRDPILGVNGQGIPVARVESGEFIVNREATKKHLGLLRAINGGGLNPAQGDLGLPRYADGGLVTFDEVVKFLKGGTVKGNPTPAPLEGYPYTWGGGLDSNWGDCSGLQSAIAALVAGVDTTGRKFATGSQGDWLAQHGFKRGRGPGKNAFETAYFNGGPWGGHTAGTIFDSKGRSINVEMGGGRGNGQFGGPAAGSRDGQFTDIWWRELKPVGESASTIAGGAIKSTSVDGVTIEGTDGKTYSVDWGAADSLASAWESGSERDRKLDEWEKRFGSFDQGGVLAGKGVFAKNTLSPERVLSPSQTKAFDELPKALYAQAASIDGLMSRLEWQKVGAEMAEGLEAKGRFGQSMLASVGRGDTLRAYAASMSLGDGVGLADRVGKIFGMDKIGSTLTPVVDAWTDMEDAAISQVDAADAIKQAEKNLADARKDGDKEAIKAAESELEKATGVAASAAAAVGQAQVAMALTVVETIVGLVESLATWINDKIQSVFEGQQAFWSAIQSSVKSIGDVAKLVEDLRSDVVGLALDYGEAMIELRAANRDVRLAAMDTGRAQLEAVVSVAEAQAAFDAQRKADMRLAAQAYDDMSLAYDRFRWNEMTSTELALDLNAKWSDESHALFAELMSAQIGLDIVRAEGDKAALEATLKQTLAALDMQKVSDSLSVAVQKLAVASGQAFGVSQAEATVAQRYATLAEERARLKAEIADSENWFWNASSYWGEYGLKATNERRIDEIDAMLAQLQAMPEAQTQITAEMQKQAEYLYDKAGWWGFIGNSAQIGKLAETGALGAGARALDEIDFQNTLIDLKASDDALRLSIEEGLAQLRAQPAIDAADLKIQALELAQESEDTWAEYWRSEDERVREALADLGRAQSDNAATIRDMSDRAAQPVTLVGSNFDADGVQALLEKLGHRVDRLESPVSTGADVLMSRR